MKSEAVENTLLDFLLFDLFAAKIVGTLGVEDSLFELGLIDSMAVVRTIAFCERTFAVVIPDEELLPENFETVRSIAATVQRVASRAA